MKSVLSTVAVMGLLMATAAARADGGKEVTLHGDGVCAKCKLGETEKCQDALLVKNGDKTVTYFLTGAKDLHPKICKGSVHLTVTGHVHEKDGKRWMEVEKFEVHK